MDAPPKRKWIPLAGEKEKEANKKIKPEAENLRTLFFKDWFNERVLSDLVIHTSKDSDAKKYYCHKFIISCSCPKLYEKLMETKFESETEQDRDHVLLVDPLKDKDEKMVTSFFQVLYNSSLMKDETIKPQLDYLAEVYKNYGSSDLAAAIEERDDRIGSAFAPHIEKFTPKVGHDTPLSDITLYFNKEKSIFMKVHRIILANYSSYFKGLFMSGMKDSNTHESIITLEGNIKPEVVAVVMEKLMLLLYGSKKFTLFMFIDYPVDQIVGMNTLAHKYFFEEIRSNTECYINSYPSMNLVEPALQYDNQTALMSATKALIEITLSIDLKTLPVDYLNVVRYTDNQNLFHAIVENQFQPGSEPRLRQINALQAHLGAAAQIRVTDLDDNNNSCLHYACRDAENNKDLIKYLIAQKLDVNAFNNAKEQPLGIALQSWVKSSYESATRRREARNKERFAELITLADSDSEGEEKESKYVKLTSVDELIMTGATVDLTNTENLQNMLCFASSFDNKRSNECWKKITEMLMTVPKDRLFRALDREYINLFLQEQFKYPITFFFEILGVSYTTKAKQLDDKEVTLKAKNLTEIFIGSHSLKLKGLKINIEGTKYITRLNAVVKSNIRFTVKASATKKYAFEYSSEAASLFCGLVAVVNGKKNVTTTYNKK